MAKIFLIGMPGSGKSTIGKTLATKLAFAFVDLDVEIERKEGATIEAIFDLKGEAYFRQVEAQVLSEVAAQEGNYIIATGGGTPCHYNGLTFMQKVGITVFINVSIATLINRLKADTTRPLLKEGVEERIEKFYKERLTVYSKAQLIIDADSLTKEKLIERIIGELKLG